MSLSIQHLNINILDGEDKTKGTCAWKCKKKKVTVQKKKNNAVTLGSELNWLSFTERWRIWLLALHFSVLNYHTL